MLSYFIHVHKVFISIARSIEIYSKKWQSYCHEFTIVDKNGLFNFFRQKKKTNEASWSEINRNGGECGFRGQQHHSLGITTGWYVGIIYYL